MNNSHGVRVRQLGTAVMSSISALLLAGCELTNPAVNFTCSHAELTADNAVATVDNTGSNSEQLFFRVYDGFGTLLYETSGTYRTGDATSSLNQTYTYTTAPAANPLRLEITSVAGGALAQDTTWYRFTGRCEGLPDASVEPVPALSGWSLLALLGLVPAIAAARRRRHPT